MCLCTQVFCFFSLQICLRIVSQKSPQKCVCLPRWSHSTSTTTALSASQKLLSICRCWLIWTSGEPLLTLYFYYCFRLRLIEYKRSECWYSVICQKSACSPFTLLTGWKCSRERDVSSFATTQFPVTVVSVLHASVCYFKCRSLFYLSLQPKSSDSVAEIPFQPSPEGFACEQQQACVHPWRDWQGQRLNGTGEQLVYISLYIQYRAWGTYTRDGPVFCLHITENLAKNAF